jgi:TPR repeat protein
MKGSVLGFVLVFLFLTLIVSFPNALIVQGSPGVSKNQGSELFKKVKLLAAAGDPEAQNKFGWLYDQGLGTIENPKIAAEWYLKSANQGFKQAQINIGVMYELGRGITQDFIEAEKWYAKAEK